MEILVNCVNDLTFPLLVQGTKQEYDEYKLFCSINIQKFRSSETKKAFLHFQVKLSLLWAVYSTVLD